MRILFFAAGGDIGGGKTHILNIAKELSKRNELRLVCFRIGEMSRDAKTLGIDTVAIDVKEGFGAAKALAFKEAQEFKPDVIHCHGSKANLIGVLVKRAFGLTVITTVHSDPKLDYMASFARRISYGTLNAYALRHMDYYVAVAARMKDLLIERGFEPSHIGVVFNGLDFSEASETPRAFKDESETITVGIAARLNPVKDLSTTVKAFDIAYKKDKRLRLSIAGTGEEEQKLRSLVKELGIEDVVCFEGWISDMTAYLSRVDINVISSISETFPYSLLEGAYVHCPAIASNVGGIPYLIEHEKTGLLFESGDYNSFAEHILRLASNQELRNQLAEGLFVKAKNEFSLQRMALDQEEIYKSAIRCRNHQGRWGAVICGAYGKGNAGDEAILGAILNEFRSIDKDMPFYIMSRKPKETRLKAKANSFYIFDLFSFWKALKKTQVFINGGGTLIQDATSTRSLLYYLYTLKAAKKRGCKVIMYGCGIGPVSKKANRDKAGIILNSCPDVITVRDSGSIEFLDELGVYKPEIILAADPTLSLPLLDDIVIDEALAEEGIAKGTRMIGFALREWDKYKTHEVFKEAAEYAYEKYGLTPVFIPMEVPRDIPIGREISKILSVPYYCCESKHETSELIGMLGRMDLVCGMRLHSLIFATAAGTPIVGISYDPKVEYFVKDSKSDRMIMLEDLNTQILKDNIDKAVSCGRSGGEEVRNYLKSMEQKNVEAARKLFMEA